MDDATKARPGTGLSIAWHVVAAIALFTVPVRLLLGETVWSLETERLIVVAGPAVAYLGAGIFLALGKPKRPDAARSLFTLIVVVSPFLLGLLLLEAVWFSRRLLLAGLAMAAGLIGAPILLSGSRLTAVGLGLAATAAVSVVGSAPLPAEPEAPSEPARTITRPTLFTSYGMLVAERYSGYVAPSSQGGGIARLGNEFVIATGDGDLYRIAWTGDGDSLRVAELPLRVPLNREDFAAAVSEDIPVEWFRVAHLLLRSFGDSLQVVASHHHWVQDRSCFVLRLSAVEVAAAELDRPSDETRWRTLYDTDPCLPIRDTGRGYRFAGPQVGGRLADLGSGSTLVTVGDLMFDGVNAPEILAQDPSADYGKVLVVHADGTAERISMGHRNPLGVHVGSGDRIWVTENGPQGGDALHELVRGGNYGWPYATYGTEYQEPIWPLEQSGGWAEGGFRPPLFAWVPSIAPSNLIEVRRGPLETWRGDLLVGSLSTRGIYRIRREGSRVAYVERIGIGSRIRDLVEAEDGSIVVWTDGGDILRLGPSTLSGGEALFAPCAGCHRPEAGAPAGLAPTLDGIYGRRIAADPDFPYSAALRALPGHWLGAELDAFLADPQGTVPGTTKVMEPVSDPDERARLVEYLRTLH